MKMTVKNDINTYTPDDCVYIWDNAFDPTLFPKMEEIDWKFKNTSNKKGPGIISWLCPVTEWEHKDTPAETAAVVEDNWNSTCKKFPFMKDALGLLQKCGGQDFSILRAWINGQTYGLGDDVHRDVSEEVGKTSEFFTFLFYINQEWGNDWGGETYLYNNNYDVLRAITPKPGRIAAFDSRLLHKGIAPNRQVIDLRMTLSLHTFRNKPKEDDGI